MLLTDEERNKFATYLEEDAASSEMIIKEAEKLPGMEPFIKRQKLEAVSCRIVAAKLRNTESQTIKNES